MESKQAETVAKQAEVVTASKEEAKEEDGSFLRKVHIKFFRMHVQMIPQVYKSLDTNRLTLLYFSLSALDVLGAIETITKDEAFSQSIIDWVYSLQVHPEPGTGDVTRCGFRGGPWSGIPFCSCKDGPKPVDHKEWPHDEAHIAATYCALCILAILGDDLSRVNKAGVCGALSQLQNEKGSFCSTKKGGESDTRFVYCAAAISTMCGERMEACFDVDAAASFVVQSQSWDGGIGMGPGTEGHGGSTYCGVAALVLMNRLPRLRDGALLLRWSLRNQGGGFKGRPEKPYDTCYSFWTGATIAMLGAYHLTNKEDNREFNVSCQTSRGGFGKVEGAPPDLLHSYYGLCGLSFIGMDGLLPLEPRLGLTQRAAQRFHLPPLASLSV